jgi:hypothetical protein
MGIGAASIAKQCCGPRLRAMLPRRLRCRMHGRIGRSLLLLPSRPHSEHHSICLLWAGHSYRLDLRTFFGQTWVLLPLVLLGHCRIRMRDQRCCVMIRPRSYRCLRPRALLLILPSFEWCFMLTRIAMVISVGPKSLRIN